MKYLILFLLLTTNLYAEYTVDDYIIDLISFANEIEVNDVDSAIQKEKEFKYAIRLWYGTDYKNDIPQGVFSAYPTQDQLTSLSLIDDDQLATNTVNNLDKWVFSRVFTFIVKTHNELDFTGKNKILSPFDPLLPEKYKNRVNLLGEIASKIKPLDLTSLSNIKISSNIENAFAKLSDKALYMKSIKDKYVQINNWRNVFYISKFTIDKNSQIDNVLLEEYNTICFMYSSDYASLLDDVKKAFNANKYIVIVFPSRLDDPMAILDKLSAYSSKIPFFIIGWTDEVSNTTIVPDIASTTKERLSSLYKEVDIDYKETMKVIRSNKDVIVNSTGKPVFIHARQFRETISIWLNALEFIPDGVAISAYGSTDAEFQIACESFYKYDAPKTFKDVKMLFIDIQQNKYPRKQAEQKAKAGKAIGMFYEFKSTGNDF